MALKSSYISILKAIKEAPHALSPSAVQDATRLSISEVAPAIDALVENGYLKLHADGTGYFTRTPKREAIANFLEGRTETLEGITFDGMIPESDYRQILSDIINHDGSAPVTEIHAAMDDELFDKAIATLKDAKLIKEHAEKRDYYFTRKPMRDKIRGFIAGTVSLAALLDPESLPILPSTQAAAAPMPAPTNEPVAYLGLPVAAFHQVLCDIYNSDHALDIEGMYAEGENYCINYDLLIGILTEAGLVKEHRDLPGHYFTRKPMRRAIELFLEMEITIEELFERAAQREPSVRIADPEAADAAAPQAPAKATAITFPDDLEGYLFESMDANLLTLRAAIDAAQRAYDALAAYRGR